MDRCPNDAVVRWSTAVTVPVELKISGLLEPIDERLPVDFVVASDLDRHLNSILP